MKRLYIVRHAKSSWDGDCSDFDRDLNERGYKDAKIIADELKRREITPDLILASPAKRVKITATIIADEIADGSKNILFKESIYESTVLNIIMILKELDDSFKNVMLFGHNPALTQVVNHLLNSYEIDNLKTCGVVGLGFDDLWSKVDSTRVSKEFYIYPKLFKS